MGLGKQYVVTNHTLQKRSLSKRIDFNSKRVNFLMLENIVDYPEVCKKIMNLNSKIRFAGIINERGKLIAGGMKEGVEPLESQKDDEMLYMELALRIRMRKEFDKQLGQVKFALAVREKALAMSFLISSDILYVVAEPDTDFCSLPTKIMQIIKG